MRRISFVLMILAVAGTSSVRGQQPKIGEALRDKARDAVIEERGPASDARREGRQERRDDRQEGRETRRDDRQEARGDRGDDHELLRLALIAALRNGDFGDRQSVREERREGRQESRDDRQEARETRRDDRQEVRGDRGDDRELLRLALLRRFATGILEIGSRSERNVARVARKVATIDKRRARLVGMIDKRRAAIGEATASCYALRLLRRFATGILEIGSRSERNVARVARKVVTIDKRRARLVGMSDKRRTTAIRIETTAGRCGCKRPAVTWCRVVDQRGLLIARA